MPAHKGPAIARPGDFGLPLSRYAVGAIGDPSTEVNLGDRQQPSKTKATTRLGLDELRNALDEHEEDRTYGNQGSSLQASTHD